MKPEYEAWKELNPDQDFSQKEYQGVILNTRAFKYNSLEDQEQANEELWGQIASIVFIVGASIICPPARMALGAGWRS